MRNIETFARVEKKYFIKEKVYPVLLEKLERYMEKDEYGSYTICNIYFDTDTNELIKTSLEKPLYKEKVRLRSYGIPKNKDFVFLELKKKYQDIVYKRRVKMTLEESKQYLEKGIFPYPHQIMREIDYCFSHYSLKPSCFLAYDRIAYHGKKEPQFRLTMDQEIRSRHDHLHLEEGDNGTKLFDDSTYIMEVKVQGGLPLWFVKILSELELYPSSFSKYGEVYKRSRKRGDLSV